MTKYEKIADQMVEDLPELKRMIVSNNGKVRGRFLATKYRSDASACREILFGILAMEKKCKGLTK